MNSEEFLKRISARAHVQNRQQAVWATEAVFDALRARITHEVGDNMMSQLPREIQKLWESGTTEHLMRKAKGVEKMDLGTLLAKVAADIQLRNIQEAEIVTRAVFRTLQEQLTPGAREKITLQLPGDIREFWLDSHPEFEEVKESPVSRSRGQKETEKVQAGTETGEWSSDLNPPFETEAPTAEEQEQPPWGPESDVPTGADMETPPVVIKADEALPQEAQAGAGEVTGAEPMKEKPTEVAGVRGEYGPETIGPAAASVFRSDDQLADDIKSLLAASDEVDSKKIDVMVQAGKVILRGDVKSPAERDAAARVASQALGTTEIDNEITIEGQP